ncbi:PX domain containing protein, putative [Trypanosoma equiperdum]|uniref:PX domain-containing protein n=2 Tax=Trypanozoon TaxID=39700 RepID=Q57ZY9_TRYB2|nr:hypothetical protein, conserved [Trypanosoma brucei brucei TREU927]AAX80956.1 hypothetical protein, conserved [Trypanosoma brucei]AAZ10652.1 hypothetical protein, conserved [Trypanosoma brucei brucei TREU927]SCU65915.1 PX domain containing protein, putative [Trypanosoma equiperdum]
MSENPAQPPLEFYVANAERVFAENDKVLFFSHWTYKMMTRSFLESYQNPPLIFPNSTQSNFIKGDGYIDYCTWHRYSDFEWFATQMLTEFPGIIFPPIPEKEVNGTIDKLTAHFDGVSGLDAKKNSLVRQRLRRLQLTLNAISHIGAIHECELMKAFTTLDEDGWRKFRDSWEAARKNSLLSIVKMKCLGLLGKLSSFAMVREQEGPVSSRLSSILVQHGEMVRLLQMCGAVVEKMTRRFVGEPSKRRSTRNICKRTAGAPLPAAACHEGCFVRYEANGGREGVVKSIDRNTAVIEWNDREGGMSRVPVADLRYPSSGVSDPVMLALHAITEQIDSHLMYLSKKEEAEGLREVGDLLWFASHLSISCINAATQLKKMESNALAQPAPGRDDTEGEAHRESLKQRVADGYTRFTEQYEKFCIPHQAQVLAAVAHKLGRIGTFLFIDEGWSARILQISSALTVPTFPPEEGSQ